jgi:F-type H+-transporting ATPase subunit epsilon
LSYRTATSSVPTSLAIIRGFAEVLPDRVTVLAETAERAGEIDLARAEAALARAGKRIGSQDPNIDWDRATIALKRAVIRVQVARKYRGAPVEAR